MKAEASGVGGSIPRASVTVKRVLSCLLDGLPFTSSDYGVILETGITCSEFEVGLRKLEVVERDVMVPSRFKRGDMWNQIHTDAFCVVLSQFLAGVKSRISDPEVRRRYLNALSGYGAVASRWPIEKRVGGHCWSYYRDNAPGVNACDGASEKPTLFHSVKCERRHDDYHVTLSSGRGKGGRLLVTRAELEEMLALVDGEVVQP